MIKRHLTLTALVLLTAVVAMGCAKPPETEVEAARQALATAETAAQTWAPEAYEEARTAMDAVQGELDAQSEKWAVGRSYDETTRLVAEAQAKAAAAQQAAVEGKESARVAAEASLEMSRATLEQASTLLTEVEACKRRPKGFTTDVAALRTSLEGLQAEHSESAALDGADYRQTRSGAEAVQSAASALVTDLENAKSALGC